MNFQFKMSKDQYETLTAVSLEHMISIVQMYIYHFNYVIVKIIPPRNDKELQLLGRAYDQARAFFNNNP